MSKRIRIKLSSMDYRLLDKSVMSIANAAKATGVEVRGPVPLPMHVKKFTVLKSPHKHKSSREQFEYRMHSRLLDIVNPASNTVDSLTKLDLSAGVEIKIDIDR